jgi:calcium-dependent protein kinase
LELSKKGEDEGLMIHKIIDSKTPKNGIQSKYHISKKLLGAGGFGQVLKINSLSDPNLYFACKIINKKEKNIDVDEVKNEIKILKSLDHPNIISYIDMYEDLKYIYIITELCQGGDLFDLIKGQIESKGSFTESDVSKMMKTLLNAINYLHIHKIAHRDIKPENIMIGDDNNLKLIDFGLSEQVREKKFTEL